MISAELEYEFDPATTVAKVDRYRREVANVSGAEAASIMASNMHSVGKSGPTSSPGGFPNSRSGTLRSSIDWAEDGDGEVIAGPQAHDVPRGETLHGALTIAELLNKGGSKTVRRRDRRRIRKSNARIKPRPFVDLTLDIIAGRMPGIASTTPLQ